jgi:serpin B
MYSDESKYLEDDMATGFLKPYADGKYAFVALLPNEGVKVADYVSSLTSNNVSRLLNSMEDVTVMTAIPKFKTEYDIEMSEILESMGMPDAFDEGLADFSKMASLQEGKLFISQVKHKTFLALDEKGTRAGAVTSVEMAGTSAPVDIKQVYLDRPFVYMIIDSELNMPIFIGTTMEI